MQELLRMRRFLETGNKERGNQSCEFCSTPIGGDHSHVVGINQRQLLCVCRACYLLFTSERAAGGAYRAVPTRYVNASSVVLTGADWEQLQIPIAIAFFFRNSALNRTLALYPSPAGATESLLPLDAWDELTSANPLLNDLAEDVEALLVRRSLTGSEAYIVPIDACYELVGRIRRQWKGFDGGEDARREIDEFFTEVRARASGR